MTENWYIILELEFDPNPVRDEMLIANRIEEKRKFWSSKANDFKRGVEYRKYTQMLSEIKRDMIGEANIRDELIRDACAKTYGPIDKTLRMIKKTEIPQDIIDKIAAKQKIDAEVVKRRATALGIKIVAAKGSDYQTLYDKYYKSKPQNADKYVGMNALLKSFNVKNLYEFLYTDTKVKNPQNLSYIELLERTKKLKGDKFYKNDSVSGSGGKLCGYCEECFKDDSAKQVYDKYLEYERRKTILDEVRNSYEYIGEVTREAYFDFISQLTEVFKNRKDAEALLTAFCKVEKIPIPISESEERAASQHIKVCRCGCMNDVSDGRTVCKACGLALQIRCPKCNELNDANINVCKCGFRFENIDRAVSLCELASDALNSMDFKAAEVHLSDADRYWPGSERVLELRGRLKELQSRVGTDFEDMQTACREKRYYEARRKLETIKKFTPGYSDPVIEEEIRSAIDTAEGFKRKAQSAKNEMDIVGACTKAYEICHDCPEIKEIISKYPPAPPTNLEVLVDCISRINMLTWTKSTSDGLMYYMVVRNEGAVPRNVKDGYLVGRVSMCNIDDRDIKPGVQYFYAVFAERAGVFSPALSYQQAVSNLFEITNVKVAAGNGLLQLVWDPIADNAVVEIERTEPSGHKTKLVCNSRNNFVDKELINDNEYWYKVFLTYTFGIKKFHTIGVDISGIPTRPPLPVDKLTVKPVQENMFLIEWENPGNNSVQFFCSTKKSSMRSGELVSVSQLEKLMTPLIVRDTSKTTGIFRYDGEETIYITAVVVKSGSAVIGASARVGKNDVVKINKVSLINGKIMIAAEAPPNCTGFVVLYKNNQYPTGISDVDTRRKYISLKQYRYDGGLVIDSNEPKNYFFSVFAEFQHDGESDYSVGTEWLFSNIGKETIIYSISVNKKLFGESTINLTFESENRQFRLPDIDIISAQDRAPMFKKTGRLFYRIPAQEAVGCVQINIPLAKGLARETYIKPFLKDESLSDRYVLKIRLGSEHKIS